MRTDNSHALAFLDLQVHLVEQQSVAIAMCEAVDFQHALAHALGRGKGEGSLLGHEGLGHDALLTLDLVERLLRGRRAAGLVAARQPSDDVRLRARTGSSGVDGAIRLYPQGREKP